MAFQGKLKWLGNTTRLARYAKRIRAGSVDGSRIYKMVLIWLVITNPNDAAGIKDIRGEYASFNDESRRSSLIGVR